MGYGEPGNGPAHMMHHESALTQASTLDNGVVGCHDTGSTP